MSYSIKNVFSYSEANATIDKMYFYLDAFAKQESIAFSPNIDIGLSGIASKMLQDEIIVPCPQIVFVTTKTEVLSLLKNHIIPIIKPKGALYFTDRIVLYFTNYILEIFYYPTLTNLLSTDGIYIQTLATIPSELL